MTERTEVPTTVTETSQVTTTETAPCPTVTVTETPTPAEPSEPNRDGGITVTEREDGSLIVIDKDRERTVEKIIERQTLLEWAEGGSVTGYTTKHDGEGNVILVINFENRPSKEVVVIDGGNVEMSNSSDNEVLQRCWANAKNSPIFWLLPVGILVAVGAPVINQVGGPVKEQLDRINAEIAKQFQFNNADNNRRPAGNGVKGIEWNNNRNNSGGGQLAAQVNELNRRLGEAFASPQAERAGQIIGVVAALGASAGLLYYWCTNEPSQDGKPLLSSKLSSKEAAPISEENAS